jgi:glycerate 2-kinase
VAPATLLFTKLSCKQSRVRAGGYTYDLRKIRRIVLIGAGKAAVPMARALPKALRDRLDRGVIAAPARPHGLSLPRIAVVKAGHPVPDKSSVRAARQVLKLVGTLSDNDLLIVVLSGGASSMLALPVEGLTLLDKQRTTNLLVRCGATISEVNAVRKHLSAIKGGRLAKATRAQVLTLILSDVHGDDVSTIGSGPTAPDPTTFKDAVGIVREYGLWRRLPIRVRIHLVEGLGGWQHETPKARSRIFKRVRHVIIGNNRVAVNAAASAARRLGYDVVVFEQFLTGEAAQIGQWMGQLGRELAERTRLRRPLLVLAGGEVTVTVRGNGRGGRAQEFALAGALSLQGTSGVWLAAMGTDGRDGPTDVAGAAVNGKTVARGRLKGYSAARYLARNDSYIFFKNVGGHIRTGPTGTNVNDLYFLLVHPAKAPRS